MTDLSVSSELLTSSKASLISSRSSSTPGEAAGVVVGTGSLGAAVAAASSSLSSASVKARVSSPYPISSSGISNSHGSGGGLEAHTSSGGAHTSSSSISHSTTTGSNTHHHHHQHHQGQVQGASLPSSTQHHHLPPHHQQQQHPPPHHHLSQQPTPMEVFNLRWDEYHRIVIDSFWSLFTEESLVDCTLVCSPTETVKVHRIVLSANSPYFRSLLATHTAHPHPIIILHDVRYSILKMLITFMYRGEVNVLPEEMTSLLKTAESLQILGLCSSQNSHTVTTTTMTTTTVLKRKASSARSSGASTPFEPAAAVSLQHAQAPVLTTISNSNASSPPLTSVVSGESRGGNGGGGGGGGGNHVGTPNNNNNSSATIQQAVYSKKARILEQQHHHHHFPAHHHHHGINHGPYHGGVGGPVGAYNSSSSSSPDTPVVSGTPTGQNWAMDQPLALKKEDSRSPSPSTPSPPPESPPPISGVVGRRDDTREGSYHHSIRMSRTSSPSELLRRSTSSSPKPGWVGVGRDAPSPPPTTVPPAHSNMYHHNQQPHHHHHSHHHQQHPHNLRKLSGQSSVSRGGTVDDAFVDEDDDPEYEDLSRGANSDRGGGGRDTGPMINDADMNASDEEEDEEETGHHPQSRNSLDLASSSRSSSTSGINLIQGASHMEQDPAVLCLRYCCPYCSTNFPSQSSLSRHIMILHPTVYSALYANAPPGGPLPHPPSSTSPIIETAHNLVKHSSHNSNDGSGGLPLENHHPHPHHHLPPGHPSYEKGGSGEGRGGSSSGLIPHDPQGGGGGSSSSSTSGQQSSIVCKFCGKPFPEVSQLIQHLPIHTGERPFKCEFCGKAFKLRHHMKDHARVHTGERPFRCSLCGKTFSRSTILKAHEKTHFPKGSGPPNNGPAEGSNGNSGAESRGTGGGGFKL